ncbi:MAG: hypothetical protein GX621_02495 [Pirellulaceae bacterium]|nr:hypothetical protein [Pirellulaceae bacterium]
MKTFTAADYAQHIAKLKQKIPTEGFTVVVEPPFVVIGDESPEMVRRRARDTVKWAVDLLKKSYYLQKHDLLERFYHRFHRRHEVDPTGYKTLVEVLGRDDMDAFKKEWEEYVLKLRFE